jgi:hypothetical protein
VLLSPVTDPTPPDDERTAAADRATAVVSDRHDRPPGPRAESLRAPLQLLRLKRFEVVALNFDVLDHALSDEIYAVLGVKKR